MRFNHFYLDHLTKRGIQRVQLSLPPNEKDIFHKFNTYRNIHDPGDGVCFEFEGTDKFHRNEFNHEKRFRKLGIARISVMG